MSDLPNSDLRGGADGDGTRGDRGLGGRRLSKIPAEARSPEVMRKPEANSSCKNLAREGVHLLNLVLTNTFPEWHPPSYSIAYSMSSQTRVEELDASRPCSTFVQELVSFVYKYVKASLFIFIIISCLCLYDRPIRGRGKCILISGPFSKRKICNIDAKALKKNRPTNGITWLPGLRVMSSRLHEVKIIRDKGLKQKNYSTNVTNRAMLAFPSMRFSF